MSRFLSLAEAVEAAVHDGDTVAMEGFTHLIPHAAGHEIIRQGRKRLTLIRMTPDLIYDQMIGMGCADKVVFSWGGNPGVGSLHRFRDAVENGWPQPLAIEEHSHAAMANAYEAGAAGLPCAIFRGYIGADLPKVNPNIKIITCPFTGEKLAAVPAIRPDVGGRPRAEGRPRRQRDARRHRRRAEGSRCWPPKRSIVTVEEIVDDFGARSPNAVILPAGRSARSHVPGGAYPSYAHGYYKRDNAFYKAWDAIARERDSFLGLDEGERAGAGPRGVRRACAASCWRRRSDGMSDYTPNEMMTIAAARALRNEDVCFVGIGMPSAACEPGAAHPCAGHHADLRIRHASPPSRTCCRCRSATANCARPR